MSSVIRFLSVLVLGSTLCAPSAAERTVLVMGDSISAAYGIEAEQGWVQLLADRLEDAGAGIDVVNASVSGETTGGGVVRLPGSLERLAPELVIIELGGNDGLRGYPIARIRDNLTRMVSMAREAGAEVLLLGMLIPPNYGERYTSGFQAAFREVAAQTGVQFVPFLLDGVATDASLMQEDGIHPTAAAQPLLLENLWPSLAPLLGLERPAAASDAAGAAGPPALE
ncbi:MAG: arylesterase [Pseudomonadales bacterium]|nr:arylesterase [Pseudomonadales bacterium]